MLQGRNRYDGDEDVPKMGKIGAHRCPFLTNGASMSLNAHEDRKPTGTLFLLAGSHLAHGSQFIITSSQMYLLEMFPCATLLKVPVILKVYKVSIVEVYLYFA